MGGSLSAGRLLAEGEAAGEAARPLGNTIFGWQIRDCLTEVLRLVGISRFAAVPGAVAKLALLTEHNCGIGGHGRTRLPEVLARLGRSESM